MEFCNCWKQNEVALVTTGQRQERFCCRSHFPAKSCECIVFCRFALFPLFQTRIAGPEGVLISYRFSTALIFDKHQNLFDAQCIHELQ